VANAVLDHADAVMLSGETAVGRYPVEAVTVMNETVDAIQGYHDEIYAGPRVTYADSPTTAAIARAVREIIQQEDIAAVAVHTATGATARMLAKNRLPCPILALSPSPQAVRRMVLYYGVIPRQVDRTPEHTRDVLGRAEEIACGLGIARDGERIVVVSGRPLGKPGCTNTLVVHRVGCGGGE
jgi:pyruvate kinase